MLDASRLVAKACGLDTIPVRVARCHAGSLGARILRKVKDEFGGPSSNIDDGCPIEIVNQQIKFFVSCRGMLDADDIGWIVTALVAVLVLGIAALTAAKWVRR